MPRKKKEQPNRADGLYEVKMTVGKKMDGSPIRKSFYSHVSKDDARRQGQKYIQDMQIANLTGNTFVEKDVTFRQWAIRWLETYKRGEVDENTYRITYEHTVKKHLLSYFGDVPITSIHPINIKEFFASKANMSKSMLSKMHMCLNGIFESAIDNDLCYKNPAKKISFSSHVIKAKKQVYTDEQIEIVEKYAMTRMPEVIILLETGLRRGELLGLSDEDIDLRNRDLSVNRSVADKRGGGILINPPKWGSYRTNPLSDRAITVLKWRCQSSGYLFPGRDGGPQHPNTWSQRLKRFMIALNRDYPEIPMLTAHELRHTYGTRLRRAGVDIYTIQKIMGHKDIKMTSEIYVHNEIDTLREALKDVL
ncbi:site-specific integrase [[Clostridium] leptum]|uniref:Site-specific integrase n=1 Tax=Solibaculum mannosilyticum TaxID=2780922 RepID=A0A7I8D1X3_9FIRM|nr:site-specific integrase [Solibaculum mannosilyticum]MCO7138080.1 site-specific integrase [[Clostridium] leptum]BCI60818.1 site-specific integrase [Solibaculum mannosilyticum]